VGGLRAKPYLTRALAAAGQPAAATKHWRGSWVEAADRGRDRSPVAWTQARLNELGAAFAAEPTVVCGRFALSLVAGRAPVSLGFVVETERQVEAHLAQHMGRLLAHDHASRHRWRR
jgi:ubiquinone biosynthesis monooxygenase Coq7